MYSLIHHVDIAVVAVLLLDIFMVVNHIDGTSMQEERTQP